MFLVKIHQHYSEFVFNNKTYKPPCNIEILSTKELQELLHLLMGLGINEYFVISNRSSSTNVPIKSIKKNKDRIVSKSNVRKNNDNIEKLLLLINDSINSLKQTIQEKNIIPNTSLLKTEIVKNEQKDDKEELFIPKQKKIKGKVKVQSKKTKSSNKKNDLIEKAKQLSEIN